MESQTSTAVAYCRSCGKPLPLVEQRNVQGTIYCAEHAPAMSNADSPWTAPPPGAASSISPGLAFLLGLIPGVGAIYNGQYAKGLLHVVIFGTLISIASSNETRDMTPIFVILSIAWVPYMAFEAYHTAQRRLSGGTVEEFSGLFPGRSHSGIPVGPVILVVLGLLFLLNNFEVFHFYQLARFWPVGLIALGMYMIFERSQSGGVQ